MTRKRGSWLLASSLLVACADEGDDAPRPDFDPAAVPLPRLSDYGFFTGDLAELAPAPGVLPYEVNAVLWSDGAEKYRAIYLPEGTTITLTEQDEWTFPTGAILIKTFAFDADRSTEGVQRTIVETRLLELAADGWDSHIYRWNDEQTEAERLRVGADVRVPYVDEQGAPAEQLYIVPDENTCNECHERDDILRPLGLTTLQMNRDVDGLDDVPVSQMAYLGAQGSFDTEPDYAALPAFEDPAGDGDLEARARAYLHGNCSHCHRPGGGGGASGLSFLAWEEDPATYGVCKVPAAAGAGAGERGFDIVPGDPDASIVTFRMASTDPEVKMPELPSLLSDEFGTELITEWIQQMPPQDCDPD